MKNLLLLLGVIVSSFYSQAVQTEKKNITQSEKINLLVLTEQGGQHESFTAAALQWLDAEKVKLNISITEINNTKPVTTEYLAKYQLVLQLDYPPYSWTKEAETAFIMQCYLANMGHGDEEFTDATQKLLFINAFCWVLSQNQKGDPFKK